MCASTDVEARAFLISKKKIKLVGVAIYVFGEVSPV
jgi:hypothetical protein